MPLFVMPEGGGVGQQAFGQVTLLAAFFELIEDAVKDLLLAPRSGHVIFIWSNKGATSFHALFGIDLPS